MLRRLNRTGLHFLDQNAADAELPGRGQLYVDRALRHVLDVFLEVELHHRIAARGADGVGGRQGHRVLRCLLTLFFLLPRLRRSEEHTSELPSLMRISYAV